MNDQIGGGSLRGRIARRLLRGLFFLLVSQLAIPVAYSQAAAAQIALKPVDLKVLVLTGNGTEPSFSAIQAFLNNIGVPHDDVILAPPGGVAVPLPPLNDQTKGFYQGVILSTGNLAVCDATGACGSALPDAGWTALDTYAATFGVRTLSYYTFPNPRYGLTFVSALATTALAPGTIGWGPAAYTVFPDLNLTHGLSVTNSYVYLAAPAVAMGESTTPLLTMNGATVGVYHRKPDGREYLALTFDNNPSLIHSIALSYGLINWVTKGIFLGSRHVYFTPQVDDLFLANELFDNVTPGCKPTGFLVDPTVDLSTQCQTDQMWGPDLSALIKWQDKIQAVSQTKGFQTTLAFNGVGAATDTSVVDLTNDLVTGVIANSKKFIWVSHTYNHFNLDCYDPVLNSGICVRATPAQSALEIDSNLATAKALGLPLDQRSMVTPEISGLTNPDFVSAASKRGIKYLIIDSSTLAANPPAHNTGVRNLIDSTVLMVPRRPTSIFYNTESPNPGDVGSLPDEYNLFYGPQGLFRIGGPGGTPFFSANQTYAQIIASESDSLLMDMLRFKADPSMYHQSNLVTYDKVNSLYSDLVTATLKKFTNLSNLPVTSLPQSTIGDLYQEQMDYDASGVKATWYPGSPANIKLTTVRNAAIPVTGFCAGTTAGCETYGGQGIRKVQVPAGQTVTIVP